MLRHATFKQAIEVPQQILRDSRRQAGAWIVHSKESRLILRDPFARGQLRSNTTACRNLFRGARIETFDWKVPRVSSELCQSVRCQGRRFPWKMQAPSRLFSHGELDRDHVFFATTTCRIEGNGTKISIQSLLSTRMPLISPTKHDQRTSGKASNLRGGSYSCPTSGMGYLEQAANSQVFLDVAAVLFTFGACFSHHAYPM